jgi:arginine exporter protein ArgO
MLLDTKNRQDVLVKRALRLSFTAGVILSSTLWFYGLGWFGRRISRLVSNKRTRVGFDLVSAFATWGATLMLIADVLQA